MTASGSGSLSASSEFSEHEKELLRYSWNCLKSEKHELGAKIFQLIFEQSPEAKGMFYFTKDKSAYEMQTIVKDKEFRFHALRFIQVIENAIDGLDDLDKLNPIFCNLGKVHTRFQESRGFHTYYWSVFIECSIFRIRRALKDVQGMDEYLDETISAWRGLLLVVVQRMKQGFKENMELRMLNRSISDNTPQSCKKVP